MRLMMYKLGIGGLMLSARMRLIYKSPVRIRAIGMVHFLHRRRMV